MNFTGIDGETITILIEHAHALRGTNKDALMVGGIKNNFLIFLSIMSDTTLMSP